MAAKAAFVNVHPDGVFAFHRVNDGSVVEVGQQPYETDDPTEIAYLETVPFVKRAAKASGKEA